MIEYPKIGTIPVEIHGTLPGGNPIFIGTLNIDFTMVTTGEDMVLQILAARQVIQAAFDGTRGQETTP